MDEAIRRLVLTRSIPERLIRSIARAPLVEPERVDRVAEARHRYPEASWARAPTQRQLECLQLYGLGLTHAQIGALVNPPLAEMTVRTHLKRARLRLGAKTNTHAVALAIRRGMIV